MSIIESTADNNSMYAYVQEGERAAYELDNRGPIRFHSDGSLHEGILDAYWRCGFYVFEDVLSSDELKEIQDDFEHVLERAPYTKDAELDLNGRSAIGNEFKRYPFKFSRPLSDPLGGTSKNNGRHPSKMTEHEPPAGGPDFVISSVFGPLQLMDSALRLYGHPKLLALAEQINGPDFTPFNETIINKPAGLGVSVAWHQDGTKQWDHPNWDQGTHGFNFMIQLYGSTAANGVWVLPGSHKNGQIDISERVAANQGSDRLPGAVPMVCEPGGIVMANRQTLHGSFANTSPDRRVTINMGFHRRDSVLGVETNYYGEPAVYDNTFIHERSRMIAVGIDARQQQFPEEERFVYKPMVGLEEKNRWNEETRESIVKDYNMRDLGI
ncbi:MAG: phytanoyl-CoA dioxygenase [Opitutaceae bacterium]|nr:phytanoyl-CoA dioxygenase [Opitutaceae bacterium]